MNARIFAYVASKLFAVYLVLMMAVPMVTRFIAYVLMPASVMDGGKSRFLLYSAIGAGVVVLVAAVFWFGAVVLSRGVDNESAPVDDMNYNRWQAMVIMLVGGISALHALGAVKQLFYEIITDSNRDPYGPVYHASPQPELLIGLIIFGLLSVVLLLAPSRIVAGLNMLRGLGRKRPAKGDVS